MGIKVRRMRGKWYLVIHFAGRRRTYCVGEDHQEAVDLRDELEIRFKVLGAAAFKNLKQKPSKHTRFKPHSEGWVEERKCSGLSEATVARDQTNLEHHLWPAFENKTLDEIDYTLLKAFCLKKSKDYTKDTVRLMLATMRSIMSEAVADGLINSNPVKNLSRFYRGAKPSREITPFTQQELHKIEEKFSQLYPWHFGLALTLARTGMRIGEAKGLKWSDVDFSRGKIHIQRNWPIGRSIRSKPKTIHSRRKIDISPQLSTALQEMRRERMEYWLEQGRTRIPVWVFTNTKGNPFDYANFVHRYWEKAVKKAKLAERNVHQLRHTFATLLLAAGAPITYVAAQLGHASPHVTLRIYAHWVPSEAAPVVSLLDKGQEGKNVNKTSTEVNTEETGS